MLESTPFSHKENPVICVRVSSGSFSGLLYFSVNELGFANSAAPISRTTLFTAKVPKSLISYAVRKVLTS